MKNSQAGAAILFGVAACASLFGLYSHAKTPETIQSSEQKSAAPPAPELVGNSWLNTPGNKPLSLASRRGKVTIVEFWTFGCSNCQANLPAYARWNEKFADQGVAIIGIHTPETSSERDPKNVAKRVKELGITYPILIDTDHANWNRWSQRYWPTVYVIDKNGLVRTRWEGELDYGGRGGEEKIATLVTALLKEPAVRNAKADTTRNNGAVTKIVKTDAEWKKLLTPEQFHIMREKGTEMAFSGDHESRGPGAYLCAACGLNLFDAKTMFDSGTGWPSFYQPIAGHVENHQDADGERTEIVCASCGGHLGHVFDDGPPPTGLRYCMNSIALKFKKGK